MQQMMLQMREMLAKFSTHMHSSRLPQVPKKFNLTKLNLLQCVGRKLVVFFFGYFVRTLLCDINMMPLIYSG